MLKRNNLVSLVCSFVLMGCSPISYSEQNQKKPNKYLDVQVATTQEQGATQSKPTTPLSTRLNVDDYNLTLFNSPTSGNSCKTMIISLRAEQGKFQRPFIIAQDQDSTPGFENITYVSVPQSHPLRALNEEEINRIYLQKTNLFYK